MVSLVLPPKSGKLPIASDVGDCLFTAMDIEQTALAALNRQRALDQGAIEPGAAHSTAFRKLRSMS